jgi:hypothetical protein
MGYLCTAHNKALREALDAPDGFLVPEHRDYIERTVRTTHPHTVVFRERVDGSTCALYALGLGQDPTYRAVASNFGGKVFAGRGFMEWLVKDHLVEMDDPKPGCLALYFDGEIWRHAEVVTGIARVTSQWGTFPVYEHGACELPARYGDKVRFFSMPSPGEPLEMFLEYAKAEGISDADITQAVKSPG